MNPLERLRQEGLKRLCETPWVAIGMASCGLAAGAQAVFEAVSQMSKGDLLIRKVGCLGDCFREPILMAHLPGRPVLLFQEVSPEKAQEIVLRLKRNELPRDLAYAQIPSWEKILSQGSLVFGPPLPGLPLFKEDSFFGPQVRLILRAAGLIEPTNLAEYVALDGFMALRKALSMSPEAVISEVQSSGLRGRGGAGFPTGVKWALARGQKIQPRYVICNADEGDPGAYMNRNELESDPFMIIEGMIIGAYAISAKEGFIYVRDEYPLAVKRLEEAISMAYAYGLLGQNILGTGFSFDLRLVKGGGAFVCGEETALIASIEGLPGRPRPRPPYPVERGLWGRPTVINNVETWANIPLIMARGGEWFKRFGTEDNTGTKVFSVVGKLKRVGLIEVPLGFPLRKLLFEIAGGSLPGRRLKAVQTGGPSGGCLPENLFDLSITYESLKAYGSIMGSGGLVALDDQTCMVDLARYFLSFTMEESCGKCLPCREGLYQMWRILEQIQRGKGRVKDLETLEDLAHVVSKTSLCGLGMTAPNPVLTTLRYFGDEYQAHLQGSCPAGVCFQT